MCRRLRRVGNLACAILHRQIHLHVRRPRDNGEPLLLGSCAPAAAGPMARNEEKAQAMLNRFVTAKKDANREDKSQSPYLSTECTNLPDCEMYGGPLQNNNRRSSRAWPAGTAIR